MNIYKPEGKSPAAQFMDWAEGYYGKYPVGQREDILEYLLPWDEAYLVALKSCVKRTYPSQYGRPPDVSVFDGLYGEVMNEKEKAIPALPPPVFDEKDGDKVKAKRLYDDMAKCGVTLKTPGWFTTVLKYRQSRGDYRNDDAKYQKGGVIRGMADIDNPKEEAFAPITWDGFTAQHDELGAKP